VETAVVWSPPAVIQRLSSSAAACYASASCCIASDMFRRAIVYRVGFLYNKEYM